MRLSAFIVAHLDPIADEWQGLGQTPGAPSNASPPVELGHCLREILLGISRDMEKPGCDTPGNQELKSGGAFQNAHPSTTHGALRHRAGGGIAQLTGEFGSLRAIVLTRWYFLGARTSSERVLQQGIRFNQAVDAALRRSADGFMAALTSTRDAYFFALGQDLRNPLGDIYTAHKVLSRVDFAPGTRQNAGRQVRQALVQLDGLVSDLLEYARDKSGPGIPLDRSPCDLRQVCEASLDLVRASHPVRVFGFAPSGDLVVDADATRIRQVLSNLLHNAIKHGDSHSLIKLAATGDETAVSLSVWNTGRVIPEEALEAIFEPRVRTPGEGADRTDQPSTSLGLGLFIAREIVNAHGGTISATSSADTGTRFTIRIPRPELSTMPATRNRAVHAALDSREAG